MTMTSALGALAQASDALTRAIADPQSGAEAAVATTIDLTLLILGPLVGAFVGIVLSVLLSALARKALSKAATASSILARVRRPGTSRSRPGERGRDSASRWSTPTCPTGTARRSRRSSCTCCSSSPSPA